MRPSSASRFATALRCDEKLDVAFRPGDRAVGQADHGPVRLRRHPPRYGEHTEEILSEAGFDSADIAALREAGVVA